MTESVVNGGREHSSGRSVKGLGGGFLESFLLTLAFGVADFASRSGIIKVLLEATNIVGDFIKRMSRMLPDDESLSILDWALLIESGKII